MITYQETPIQELHDPLLAEKGVRLLVKREDLNHPLVSGNKWWKLKYNLEEAAGLRQTLLTFGGAYSNHIFATAAATHELGLKSIGIIRGEETLPLNHTMAWAKKNGMQLHYVSRENYRHKTENAFIQALHDQFGEFYLIPEGGTNDLALKGCAEFARTILSKISFDYLCLPVGTGGTMAGILAGLEGKKRVIGFSVLKGGAFLTEEVKNLVQNYSGGEFKNWRMETDYHFGGYGKSTDELEESVSMQLQQNNLPLDPVYTSKMTRGIYDLVKKGHFERGSIILALHTGGLQGKSF